MSETNTKKFKIAGAILAALVLPLAACTAAPGQADGPRDTLVYATGDAEPDCLDPHVGGNYPQALLATQVLESLVSLDKDGNIVPWLATAWTTSEDGLSWDFTLDPKAKFSDGTAVDAAAIKANIEHLQNPDTGSSTGYLAVQQIAEVERREQRAPDRGAVGNAMEEELGGRHQDAPPGRWMIQLRFVGSIPPSR